MIGRLLKLFTRSDADESDLSRIESILRYKFRDSSVLEKALTHRSVYHNSKDSGNRANELLEFLGDAVLDLIVVEHLYRTYPKKSEGDLSKIKSALVNGSSLQKVAEKIGLGDHIKMSDNEERNGGRKRRSILEDTFEAVIAAIYLDGGHPAAENFVRNHILSQIPDLVKSGQDNNYKSLLLEFVQARGIPSPVYNVTAEHGPDHDKNFEVEAVIDGRQLGIGLGRSKKHAQQQAARVAFQHLSETKN